MKPSALPRGNPRLPATNSSPQPALHIASQSMPRAPALSLPQAHPAQPVKHPRQSYMCGSSQHGGPRELKLFVCLSPHAASAGGVSARAQLLRTNARPFSPPAHLLRRLQHALPHHLLSCPRSLPSLALLTYPSFRQASVRRPRRYAPSQPLSTRRPESATHTGAGFCATTSWMHAHISHWQQSTAAGQCWLMF